MHWIYPSIGGALYAFGMGSVGEVAFTLLVDSYRDVSVNVPIPQTKGDANAYTVIARCRIFHRGSVFQKRFEHGYAVCYGSLVD